MFKYIGYNLKENKLVATNSESDWMSSYGSTPIECEYFTDLEDFITWHRQHPNAHWQSIDKEAKYWELRNSLSEADFEQWKHLNGMEIIDIYNENSQIKPMYKVFEELHDKWVECFEKDEITF